MKAAHELPPSAPQRRRSVPTARTWNWLPNAALVTLLVVPAARLVAAAQDDTLGIDFKANFVSAAEALLDGRSPYPENTYPPLGFFLSVPFVLLPSPEVLMTIAVAACVPASLWLLGVRDWRCYIAAFLWVFTYSAIQTGNVTLPLVLAAAICWRWRQRAAVTSAAGGLAVALKILAWPLGIWLATTGRIRAAIGIVVVAIGVTLALWATLGFSGLSTYPDTLDSTHGTFADRAYTFRALALDAGLPAQMGVFLSFVCLALLLAAAALCGRRGDDRRSFACATVAMVVATPLVWLHSFAFLLVPVALFRPRLSPIWLVPLVLWPVSHGTGNGEPWQTVATMAVAATVAIVALWPPRDRATVPGRLRTE